MATKKKTKTKNAVTAGATKAAPAVEIKRAIADLEPWLAELEALEEPTDNERAELESTRAQLAELRQKLNPHQEGRRFARQANGC